MYRRIYSLPPYCGGLHSTPYFHMNKDASLINFIQGHRKMFLIRGAGLLNVLREAQMCGQSPNWLGGSGGIPPQEDFRKTDALRSILVQSEPICSTPY